ncbi:MAG TPA: DUF1254 domain-containing protein [Trebonia sp.]
MTIAIELHRGFPVPRSAADSHAAQDLRRALEAYHFFYPTVSMEGIVRGTRAAGAADNTAALLIMAKPRHAGFTLNSDTPYAGGILDLGRSGPMVVELPAGPLVGLADDHHQRWITDMGLPGADAGEGGRHLILPPGWDGPVPDGYLPARSSTWTALVALRALPLGGDLEAAIRLLTSVRIYPLGSSDRDRYEFNDATDRPADTTPLAWEDNLDYWRVLHEVISVEPPVEEMRAMLGTLAELGIAAGQPFQPSTDAVRLLSRAAEQGRDEMLVAAFASRRPDRLVWPGRNWEWVGLRPENGSFERDGSLDVEARDRWFAQAIVASPAMFRRAVGQGSLYWLACRDSGGAYLDGGRSYKLTVPLPVPASLFWSVTGYDSQTRSEISTPQGRAALRSLFEDLSPGGADQVDLYFGPNRPGDADARWIQTAPGRGWFCYFRIYGPEAAALDGTWKPGDFTLQG